jgi:hypothetical protein
MSKDKSNVCILDRERSVMAEFEIEHNEAGFHKLESHLSKDMQIGMETTGTVITSEQYP